MNAFLNTKRNAAKTLHLELSRFFELAHDPMVVFTRDGFIECANSAFVEMLGYSNDELQTMNYQDLLYHEDQEGSAIATARLQADESLENFENRWVRKDGTLLHLSWRALAKSNENCIYSAARDITELKRQERVLQEEHAKMALASKMSSLGRMASGMAHEINNPLTIVFGQAHLLKQLAFADELSREEVAKAALQIEFTSSRIVEIINGLRTFAREGSGDPFEFVSLKKVLNDTLVFCAGLFRKEAIEFTYDDIPDDIDIYANAVQISQVLLNLLNNAHDAIEGRALRQIHIEFIEREDTVGLAVRDTGEGVPPKIVSKLFEPFVTSKDPGKGTGLGLSISKGIIKSHSGRLFLDAEYTQGARFVFLLPKVT